MLNNNGETENEMFAKTVDSLNRQYTLIEKILGRLAQTRELRCVMLQMCKAPICNNTHKAAQMLHQAFGEDFSVWSEESLRSTNTTLKFLEHYIKKGIQMGRQNVLHCLRKQNFPLPDLQQGQGEIF
jgi:hypothetical protein